VTDAPVITDSATDVDTLTSGSVDDTPRTDVRQARAALLVFALVEIIAFPLMLSWEHGTWFQLDDWDFIAVRTGGSLHELFRPHFEHWVTLPILAYRFMWWIFGIRTITPYQVLVIVGHLAVAALLRGVMRRAGVNPWLATAAAGLFVFLGAGAENILVAFQITFVGALLFGLVHLLLADHDGPVTRRDAFGVLAGLAGLMCSGVAITMVITVGYATLLRRGWRVALLHTGPLASIYLLWRAAAPDDREPSYYHANSPGQILRFVAVGVRATLGGLGQLPGVGLALGAVLIVGLVLMLRADPGVLRGRAAAPIALLAGAITFLAITGVYRSGDENGLAVLVGGFGPEHARTPRYIHIVAAMALPALALAADALVRRWRSALVPLIVLVLVGLPANVHKLADYAKPTPFARAQRTRILTAPHTPIVEELPRSLPVATFLTLGWLLDSEPSGRVPSPPPRTPKDIANASLQLALQESRPPVTTSCAALTTPTVRTLRRGDRLTLKSGNATITYMPVDGVPSAPKPFRPLTVGVAAEHLRVRLSPTAGAGPTVICG
jgi:hypothetical protein